MKKTGHKRVDRMIKEIFTLSAYEQHTLLSKVFYRLLFDPYRHGHDADALSMTTIELVVSGYYGIPVVKLRSRSRLQEIVFARHMAMYLARKLTLSSLTTIGKHFGKDHATALYANKKIDRLLTENNDIKKDIYFLCVRLNPEEVLSSPPALPADSS